jgi:alkylation response protein AidB-like acyl-CoA dehydrogenase
MDLDYSPEEEAFRGRVAAWIAENAPAVEKRKDLEELRAWQRRLNDAGYLGAGWPSEHGGADLSPMQQAILNEELARANAPGPINAMAIWWVGPAIIRYGTDEQKKRFLGPILTADEIWATGYSEPGSGSDMAAARCRADRDGDDYIINGQKVWTTIAHFSDWYFVLVRTSTEGPKWAGLSLLLIDMKSPGVEVQPIRQITGDSEFNEVFLDDVRVPVTNLLGREGQGWEIVTSADQ